MRITMIGLGPVGQILSVFLQDAGCTVSVYDKDEQKSQLILQNGIELRGLFRNKVMIGKVLQSPQEVKEFQPDVVILAVKIYHTPAVVSELKAAGVEQSLFICAQNGIDSEAVVCTAYGDDHVFRMVLNFAGVPLSPNVTEVTFFNAPNYLASIDDSKEDFSRQFSELLTEAGLNTEHVNSFWLQNRVWEKTILNASLSALCGITGLTMSQAMARPGLAVIVEQLIEESIVVAKAEEIYFGENFNKLCLRYLRNAGNHFPSLAIDMKNKRPTEVEYFNGMFVKYGLKHYLKTPLHAAFTNMVIAHTQS